MLRGLCGLFTLTICARRWLAIVRLVRFPSQVRPGDPRLIEAIEKYGVALLLLGFAAQYWMDRRAVALDWLPAWYGQLRRVLTAGVAACLALALVQAG